MTGKPGRSRAWVRTAGIEGSLEVVVVRIPPTGRCVTCVANGLDLAAGDDCVIESERGIEFALVARPAVSNPFRRESDAPLPRVLRRATRDDEEAYTHKVSIEREGRKFCLARIAERRVPMRLGHVERQLDGKKMTFHFTADGRVDFRDLVRDLTAQFHTRVELRQIGARDDAGMLGGCGVCGRVLCCVEWIRGFDPVSIKMAKTQGLSLNPAKISGTCGRLMCCLKYEYDPSSAARRRAGAAAGGGEPSEGGGAPQGSPPRSS